MDIDDKFVKCAEVFLATKYNTYFIITFCSLCKTKYTTFDEFISHIKLHILQSRNEKHIHRNQKDDLDYSKIWSDAEDYDSTEETENEEELKDEEALKDEESLKYEAYSLKDEVESLKNDEASLKDDEEMNDIGDNDDLKNIKLEYDTEESKIDEELDENFDDEDPLASTKEQTDSQRLLVNDRQLLNALIIEYEKEPQLWDIKKRSGRKYRRDAYWRIADKLNEKFKSSFNFHHVFNALNILRCRYRVALHRQQKGLPPLNLWFLKKLEFLREGIDIPLQNRRKIIPAVPEPITNLRDSQRLELTEIYKNYPILWNLDNIKNRFEKYKQDTLNEMLKFVNENSNLDLTLDSLQNELNYIHQICSEEKKRKLEIERKNEKFTPQLTFYNKISYLEPNVAPFPCPNCEQQFMMPDKLKYHYAKHNKTRPFTCPICNKGVTSGANYNNHLRRHLGYFDKECEICGKRFVTKAELEDHQRLHTGEKPYFCEICGYSMASTSELSRHKKQHMAIIRKYNCQTCSKSFAKPELLKDHIAIHVGIRDKVCDICGKGFVTKKYLRQHKLIHEEKKRYNCKICNKAFNQTSGLYCHLKTHNTKT